ncbi:coordinator of PRMT5 and differentiation stimulator isoform X2 [Lagopus leucura]|uniref:coordinator of PRMT5 and differentiation stimulator isoform X2 n=1 Tax=Lagopus leucura TaxID=30410 RepID=UPI001C6832C9|nr:coordinator of PRMT5 and differentiation stimulator isoform X2 [Lagopus leucura]
MAATLEHRGSEEEQPPNKKETMTWKPRDVKPKILGQTKADECLLKNALCVLDSDSEGSEFSDVSACEDAVSLHTNTDVEDLCGELSRMSEDATFAQQPAALTYEMEDWDKELEESERSPYGSPEAVPGRHEVTSPGCSNLCLWNLWCYGPIGSLEDVSNFS